MAKMWVGLMISKSLLYKDDKLIGRELGSIFGEDLLEHRTACSDQMIKSGEYYIFVLCKDFWKHADMAVRNRNIIGVIPSKEEPHFFTSKEVDDFVLSAGKRIEDGIVWEAGDVVKVKDGYLSGLYGIVEKVVSKKKCRILFSFYVRQFSENLNVTSLEYIGKIPGYCNESNVNGNPIIVGTHIVHKSKLYRSAGRES